MSAASPERWGLRTLMTQTLDPGYAIAARTGRPPARGPRALVIVVAVIAGIVFGVAIRQQERQLTDRQQANDALIAQIDLRSQEVDGLGAQLSALREEISLLREQVLGSTQEGAALLDALAEQESQAALTPVNGPGIRITVSDPAPDAGGDPVGSAEASAEKLISDGDLQQAVNALWGSGAEAIAVNGHRIGPLTAVRQAGGTVLVDFQPVTSPYVLDVVGNPSSLPADFAASDAGRRFGTYRSAHAAGYQVDVVEELHLPAVEAASGPATKETD